MKSMMRTAVLIAFMTAFLLNLKAQEQDKPKDVFEQAEIQADRLQRDLNLEEWQVFYVDSILKHDYSAMVAEYEKLKAAKVANSSLYVAVQDKWMEKIDSAYRKVFDARQWEAYLKAGGAKAQKARARRKAKGL